MQETCRSLIVGVFHILVLCKRLSKNLLLDPIGDHFRHDQHFAPGPIDPAKVPAVINEIVSFCFQQFSEMVASPIARRSAGVCCGASRIER